jgi:hypothetical protein
MQIFPLFSKTFFTPAFNDAEIRVSKRIKSLSAVYSLSKAIIVGSTPAQA